MHAAKHVVYDPSFMVQFIADSDIRYIACVFAVVLDQQAQDAVVDDVEYCMLTFVWASTSAARSCCGHCLL